jgi:hypothetical protein
MTRVRHCPRRRTGKRNAVFEGRSSMSTPSYSRPKQRKYTRASPRNVRRCARERQSLRRRRRGAHWPRTNAAPTRSEPETAIWDHRHPRGWIRTSRSASAHSSAMLFLNSGNLIVSSASARTERLPRRSVLRSYWYHA